MDFAERAARNEEVFRAINERIDAGAEQHGVTGLLPFHCECGRSACTEMIDLRPHTYERIAKNPLHFIVKPGHLLPGIELIVSENDDFLVVEKVGEAREEIEREHPRPRHRNDTA